MYFYYDVISFHSGSQTYLIKLKASDNLEKLRTYLRSYRDGDDNFEVVRSYPYQVRLI